MMKKCDACGASNAKKAKFCNECGKRLTINSPTTTVSQAVSPPSRQTISASAARSIAEVAQKLENNRQADIMFVLDCTGSMRGEIDAIKDAIVEFAEMIESEGIRVRVGLIEFRDRLINEPHRVLTFNGEVFTTDASLFRTEVSKLTASGGGDEPESSLDALMLALEQPFNTQGQKVLVLITDAPPHIPDKDTKTMKEVTDKIKEIGIEQIYPIIRVQEASSKIYLKLYEGTATKGMVFGLGQGEDFRERAEHFKETLKKLGGTISKLTS